MEETPELRKLKAQPEMVQQSKSGMLKKPELDWHSYLGVAELDKILELVRGEDLKRFENKTENFKIKTTDWEST